MIKQEDKIKEARFRNPRDYKDLGIGNVKYSQRKGEKKPKRKDVRRHEEIEIDEKWEEVFGDETYQDSAWFDPADVRSKIQQARAKVKPHSEDEEELAHKLHQQRTNESKKQYKNFVKEQTGNAAVFTFGRFNPPTIGHEKLLKVVENTAKIQKGDYFVFMSHSQDAKKNPLSYNQKMMP